MKNIETAETNADHWSWSPHAAAVRALASAGTAFTIRDVYDLGTPAFDHPCRAGALISSFERRGLIELVGARVELRDNGRSVPTRVWRGTDLARQEAA